MISQGGRIALMGSGELTSTMVEVHKRLLDRSTQAVFLDTPAGFQLNVDDISKKAEEYFRRHVQHPLQTASLKSAGGDALLEKEQAYQQLRSAGYILIGPGSPTYFVREVKKTRVPEILVDRVRAGGCLVAASAAALTVGLKTLPVYEIYKVGHEIHWTDGLELLAPFGLHPVVIPHWNNAEGGTHDTRFCFMGKSRFERLEAMLPEDTVILGLDEHTACIIDFGREEVNIEGIGHVTIRQNGRERHFGKGEPLRLEMLKHGFENGGVDAAPASQQAERPASDGAGPGDHADAESEGFWETVHRLDALFNEGLAEHDERKTISSLLELDRLIWKALNDFENDELISQAREVFRDLIVLMGMELGRQPKSFEAVVAPLVERLLELRADYKARKKFQEADALRDVLQQADIVVEDTPDGFRWRMREKGLQNLSENPDG